MFNLFLETTAGSGWSMYLILGGMLVVMMLLTILPQRKRQKQMREMLSSMKVGNRIKTIGGFVGRIVSMNEQDNTVVINIGTEKEPVNVTIDRNGIGYNMDMPQVSPRDNNDNNNNEEKPSI